MITGQKESKLKQLIYNFYCDFLELYKKNHPEFIISEKRIYTHIEDIPVTGSNPTIDLLSANYYYENIEEIKGLESFKKIIQYIEEPRKSDSKDENTPRGEFIQQGSAASNAMELDGAAIYLIVKEIFESENQPSFQFKWNFNPCKITDINLDEDVILRRIKNPSKPLQTEKFFYLLQNFEIESTHLKLRIGTKEIEVRKLSNKEKSLIMNGVYSGTRNIQTDILSIKTAFISSHLLNENEVKRIIALFRIFKAGDFRLYGIGQFKKLGTREYIEVNVFDTIIERPLVLDGKLVEFDKTYKVAKSEIKKIKTMFEKYYEELKSFEFACEFLSLLHATNDEVKIPIIFYILESFFPNIKGENTYRLSTSIARLLKENYEFSQTIRDCYKLRSDIVHGDKTGLPKKIAKIPNSNASKCSNIQEVGTQLELIMRRTWMEILKRNLHSEKDIEAAIFKINQTKKVA